MKECTHSYGRNVPKLPLGLGILLPSFYQVRNLFLGSLLIRDLQHLLSWRWWDNQLLEELLLTMSWTSLLYSRVFMFLGLLHRAQTIHHFHPWVNHVIIPFIGKWSINLRMALLHVILPSLGLIFLESSCILLHGSSWKTFIVLSFGSPA